MEYIDEKTTRKRWIDEKLRKSGWESIVPYSDELDTSSFQNTAVEEYPTETGPADYALFTNGKLIAFVEAKKISLAPQNVLSQAQRYVKGTKEEVPFIYSTNGEIIWFQDLRTDRSRSRQVQEFHSPKALTELLTMNREEKLSWFMQNPPDYTKLRYYQKDAIQSVEQAIVDHKRSMLVAMATGTGKTFTVASLIYRLLKSGTSKRI